jgi:hypothetical protein
VLAVIKSNEKKETCLDKFNQIAILKPLKLANLERSMDQAQPALVINLFFQKKNSEFVEPDQLETERVFPNK